MQPNKQIGKFKINDNSALEKQADEMDKKVANNQLVSKANIVENQNSYSELLQLKEDEIKNKPNPIYSLQGKYLGETTDSNGDEAIIMAEENYKNGMSYNEAISNGKIVSELKGKEFHTFIEGESYQNLKKHGLIDKIISNGMPITGTEDMQQIKIDGQNWFWDEKLQTWSAGVDNVTKEGQKKQGWLRRNFRLFRYDETCILFGYDTGIDDDWQPVNEISFNVEALGKVGPLYGLGRARLYSSDYSKLAGASGFIAIGLTSAEPFNIISDLAYIQRERLAGKSMEEILSDKDGKLLAFNVITMSAKPYAHFGVFFDFRKVKNVEETKTIIDVLNSGKFEELTIWYERGAVVQWPGGGPKSSIYQISNSEGEKYNGLRIGLQIQSTPTAPIYTGTPFVILGRFNEIFKN